MSVNIQLIIPDLNTVQQARNYPLPSTRTPQLRTYVHANKRMLARNFIIPVRSLYTARSRQRLRAATFTSTGPAARTGGTFLWGRFSPTTTNITCAGLPREQSSRQSFTSRDLSVCLFR